MKLGIALTAAALGAATLVGCGQLLDRQQRSDSISMTDGSRAFNNFGPSWQADTNLARLTPKEDDAPYYPPDDDVVVQPPIAEPSCPEGPIVHFDTPEAAMTYLA